MTLYQQQRLFSVGMRDRMIALVEVECNGKEAVVAFFKIAYCLDIRL
jgi:hypothetical protein